MISTRRPRRPFPGLHELPTVIPSAPAPGSPRDIARKMALEGAVRLARQTGRLADLDDPSFDQCPLSRPKRGPLSRLRPLIRPIVAALALMAPAGSAPAQISSASTAALGLGNNYNAAAFGIDAIAWNPAGLGFSRDGSAFVMLAVQGSSGLQPVSLGTFADYSGVLVPDGTKREWLRRISADGGQSGMGGADVTWLGLRKGRFGLQFSTSARLMADVTPGIAELVLFGNVDETGQASNLDLTGSRLMGFAWSAVGASVAAPFVSEAGVGAVGFTFKYVLGHGMAFGENSSGAAVAAPVGVTADFPLVHTDFANGGFSLNNGNGFGLDVGGMVQQGPWTLSGTVQNLISTFEWKVDRLMYRPLSLRLAENEASTSTDAEPLSTAPAELIDRVARLKFEPVWTGGIAWSSPSVLFTADARFSSSEGMIIEPTRHLGGGLEYRIADWLPVRVGGAWISMGEDASGWQAGAGLGLEFGGWNMSASALRRNAGAFGSSTAVMVSLFGAGR